MTVGDASRYTMKLKRFAEGPFSGQENVYEETGSLGAPRLGLCDVI